MIMLISAYMGLGNFILKTLMINPLAGLYPDCMKDITPSYEISTLESIIG